MVHSICFIAMMKLNRAKVFCGLSVLHCQPRLWKGGDLSATVVPHLLLHNLALQHLFVASSLGVVDTNSSPGRVRVRLALVPPSPQILAGLVGLQLILPPPHCAPVRLQECNMMERDFWMVWRLLPFVSLSKTRNRATEKGSRCLF